MRSKLFLLFSLVIVATMVLAACQPAATPVVQTVVVEKPVTVEQTVVVKETQVVEQTKIVEGKPVIITAKPAPTKPPAPTVAPTKAPAGPKVLKISFLSGDIPTLDPSLAEDTSSVQVIQELTVGLTQLDEVNIAVVPGIAEKWDLSADGKTITFHLRKNIPWVKYDTVSKKVINVMNCAETPAPRMVTAADVAYGIERTLDPKNASPYAYVLYGALGGDQGKAVAYKDVVKVVDDATIEIKFFQAAAYNLNIAGMWVARAEPKWLIEGDDCTQARGERWIETGFNQSYGPYALKEWVHDSYLTLVKNPLWPGDQWTPVAKIDEININMIDDTGAMANYEAGDQDVVNPPLADMDRVKKDATLSKELKIAPSLSTYYYGYNTKAKIVDDVRVRQALSMAVDRQALIDNVTKGQQEPAQWFCRPGLVGCPTIKDYPNLGVKFDVAKAKATLDAYLKEKNTTADKLDLTLVFNTSSGHQKIAEAIQAMWKQNLGVNVKLVNQEWSVFLKTTKDPAGTPQIFRMGWSLDYPDANNFTFEVAAFGGSQNPAKGGGFNWKNPKFEQLVRDAAKEQDPKKRIDLYSQAEQILVWDDAVMIPLYWYTTVVLTKPYVTRTYSNTGSQHYEKWDITK